MAGNPRGSGYDRAAHDWYREPKEAIDMLLDVESFHGTIHDPACGSGTIPKACEERGHYVVGSDLIDRGYGKTGIDFLKTGTVNDNIVTNPPYNLARDFIEHGLRLARRKVAVLVRLAFLEGQRRGVLFDDSPFARVWVFRNRISMPPGESDVEAKNGSVAFCWCVWDHALPKDEWGLGPRLNWLRRD